MEPQTYFHYEIIMLSILETVSVSQEPSLGFEPTSLRFSESAVQHSTHRATRVLRRRGRKSLTQRLPHYSPFFISEWSLSALALHRCPPWPPIVARLDPRSWPALTLTPLVLNKLVRLGPQPWSALTPDRGLPWPTISARLDLLWVSTQKFQAGIVQYNQFAVDAGTSDTKCRRSRRWDSNPRRCDSLSQPSSTQPTAPQEYSGGEADRVWPGAYHKWVHLTRGDCKSCCWCTLGNLCILL